MPNGADDGYFDNLHRIEELEKGVRQIRRLNDEVRVTGLWGVLVFSSGLHVLGPQALREIRQIVADYDGFDPENDIYEEHDFGAAEFGDHKIFWKIDCYNKSLTHTAVDAADGERESSPFNRFVQQSRVQLLMHPVITLDSQHESPHLVLCSKAGVVGCIIGLWSATLGLLFGVLFIYLSC